MRKLTFDDYTRLGCPYCEHIRRRAHTRVCPFSECPYIEELSMYSSYEDYFRNKKFTLRVTKGWEQ